MKKIIVPFAALALVVTACNKSNLQPAQADGCNNTPQTPASKPPPKGWYQATMFKSGWCSGYPINCINIEPGPVVYALKKAMDDAVKTGSRKAVAELFKSDDLQEFNQEYLIEDAVGKLTSGDYYLCKGQDKGPVYTYMAGKTFPVTVDNLDFAFQIGTP